MSFRNRLFLFKNISGSEAKAEYEKLLSYIEHGAGNIEHEKSYYANDRIGFI